MERKSDEPSLVLPETVGDLLGLLDNDAVFENSEDAMRWSLKMNQCLETLSPSDKEKRRIVDYIQGPLSPAVGYLLFAVVSHLSNPLKRKEKIFCWERKEIDFVKIQENLENYNPEAKESLWIKRYLQGYFYFGGFVGDRNPEEAFSCWKKLAEEGYAPAQNDLGYCYQDGIGVEADAGEAVKYYTAAARQGNASAQNNLGYCYQHGIGVEADAEEAVKYYTAVAQQGNAAAQYNLGHCYQEGIGVDKDLVKANDWYMRLAAQGETIATYRLLALYRNTADFQTILLTGGQSLIATVKQLGVAHPVSQAVLYELKRSAPEGEALKVQRSINLYIEEALL